MHRRTNGIYFLEPKKYMTENSLKHGQMLLDKIKKHDQILDYFRDREGKIKATQKDAIQELTKFLNEAKNIANEELKTACALNCIHSIIDFIVTEKSIIESEFKSL